MIRSLTEPVKKHIDTYIVLSSCLALAVSCQNKAEKYLHRQLRIIQIHPSRRQHTEADEVLAYSNASFQSQARHEVL